MFQLRTANSFIPAMRAISLASYLLERVNIKLHIYIGLHKFIQNLCTDHLRFRHSYSSKFVLPFWEQKSKRRNTGPQGRDLERFSRRGTWSRGFSSRLTQYNLCRLLLILYELYGSRCRKFGIFVELPILVFISCAFTHVNPFNRVAFGLYTET